MKLTEFYKERFELLENDFFERYTIQRDKGNKFIYQPFPTLEEFLEEIESDIQDNPYNEEIEEDLTATEEEKLLEEYYKGAKETYNRIAAIRKEFEKGEK